MADINAAIIGFAGVLAGGYFNNFFAEDYKRFRDSQALAGALAGELQSHAEAVPLIKSGLSAMLATVKSDVGRFQRAPFLTTMQQKSGSWVLN